MENGRCPRPGLTPRILILTASVGAGHDRPARTLADQLRAERPDVDVVTEDCLSAMGRAVAAVSEDAARRLLPVPVGLGRRLLVLHRLA